jgi:hypothetical protein
MFSTIHVLLFRDTEGKRIALKDSDNADLGFSYTAKSVFSLFNPTTPIKGILSVFQYHLYFEWSY